MSSPVKGRDAGLKPELRRLAAFVFPVAILFELVALGAGKMPACAVPVTTGSLVDEMVDMHRLARVPDPFFRIVQFSSYDRRSSLPGGKDWFGNSDGFGGEPIPNFEGVIREPGSDGVGEYLVCDVAGPGAVVRTWGAAIKGEIRVYLDGKRDSVYAGPSEAFLQHPYTAFTKRLGLDDDILSQSFCQSYAAYCPFPFAERCRIEWTGDLKDLHFYHVTIRRYERDAKVVTFQPEDLLTYKANIERAAAMMRNPDGAWEYRSTERPVSFHVAAAPGARREALTLDGPKAVERLSLVLEAEDRELALRQTILHVVFDDFPLGQVQSPVGDFFGAAPGINPYRSLPFTVEPDGTMTCRYVMPFRRNMRIVFENVGEQSVTVRGEVLAADCKWDEERSMHFRARWRIDHGMSGEIQDVPYLVANGGGTYVGSAAFLLNPCNIPSGHGSWWGEGDEKVFTDEDARPSIFGTGSEDYFNYAWGNNAIFALPYCGQPRTDGPANRGFVTNYRWHIVDCIPFRRRLSFYMELFPHEPTEGFAYARIAYHYGKPGITDDHLLITREDVRRQELPVGWQPEARLGAAGSVFLDPVDHVRGVAAATVVPGPLWSGGRLYRWLPQATGEELAFALPIDEEADYIIRIAFAQDAESGKVSCSLDGKRAGFGGSDGVADLYRPHRVMIRCLSIGRTRLEKGSHVVTLRYEGCPDGNAAAGVGIDFIWVQKLPAQ